jgi:hypothetical protein
MIREAAGSRKFHLAPSMRDAADLNLSVHKLTNMCCKFSCCSFGVIQRVRRSVTAMHKSQVMCLLRNKAPHASPADVVLILHLHPSAAGIYIILYYIIFVSCRLNCDSKLYIVLFCYQSEGPDDLITHILKGEACPVTRI